MVMVVVAVRYALVMQVEVRYFGVLKDLLRRDRQCLELAGPISVEALMHRIRGAERGDDALWNSLAVAINEVYSGRDDLVRDGDEVALLPPVSGGLGAA
jgi:molybdopterin converting factor small subunit